MNNVNAYLEDISNVLNLYVSQAKDILEVLFTITIRHLSMSWVWALKLVKYIARNR